MKLSQLLRRFSDPGKSQVIESQQAEILAELKKQSDNLIVARNFLESSIKKEMQNATRQIEAFVAVQNYLNTGELPQEMHGWPISPDFAQYLIELIEIHDYDLVIEFGSGVSTVLMAKVLARKSARRQGRPPVVQVAFEHLEKFHQQTLAHLAQADLAEAVKLVHAPLQPYQAPNGKQYDYYACHETLQQLAAEQAAEGLRILVLVDGPPAATGKHARYPALPIVMAHLGTAKIDFLMDDYIRDDEKEIVALWQQELKAANLSCTSTYRKLEKDACLLAVNTV